MNSSCEYSSPPRLTKPSSLSSNASASSSTATMSSSRSNNSSPTSSNNSSSNSPSSRRIMPPPPRIKRSTHTTSKLINNTPPRTPGPSPPPPPRVRRVSSSAATVVQSRGVMASKMNGMQASSASLNANIRNADMNGYDEMDSTPLLVEQQQKQRVDKSARQSKKQRKKKSQKSRSTSNRDVSEHRALLLSRSTSETLDETTSSDSHLLHQDGADMARGEEEGDIYVQLEALGQQLDDEILDLQKLDVDDRQVKVYDSKNSNEHFNTSKHPLTKAQSVSPPGHVMESSVSTFKYSTPDRVVARGGGSVCSNTSSSTFSTSGSRRTSLTSPPRLNNRSSPRARDDTRSGSETSLDFNDHEHANGNNYHGSSSNFSPNNSQYTLSSQSSSQQSNFSSASAQAAISAKLAARDEYQVQKMRMESLLGSPSMQSSVHRKKKKLSKEAGSSGRNNEQCESAYQVQIHPSSIRGTAEAAAWHVHGQTTRRRTTRGNNENCALMNGHAVMKAISSADSWSENDAKSSCNEDANHHPDIKMDVEDGIATISATSQTLSSLQGSNNLQQQATADQWSTGIAAAIVTGVASRYHKSLFLFPHGRRVLLPIIMGTLGTALSFVLVLGCQFMTILPREYDHNVAVGGEDGMISHQVFQLGPWRYLSANPTYSDGEVCLPFPSDMVMDTSFVVARSASAMACTFGCMLVLWTLTLLCVPTGRGSMNGLGVCFVLVGLLEGLTGLLYLSESCKSSGVYQDVASVNNNSGGTHYFDGTCSPNQDLVYCIASSILFIATGWILHISTKFSASLSSFGSPLHPTVNFHGSDTNAINSNSTAMEVYTWSSEAKSSNPSKGILRTIEKSWTRVPNGSTIMATVFVEQRGGVTSCGNGSSSSGNGGKVKRMYSVQTELLPA